jgi:hypothetical protein
MIVKVIAGSIKGNNGGKVKKYPGNAPEGRFPEQVNGLGAGKELPVPGQAGYNNDNAFQHYGWRIDLFPNVDPNGIDDKKKGEED